MPIFVCVHVDLLVHFLLRSISGTIPPLNRLLIAIRTDQQQAIAPLCTNRLIINLNKDKISSIIHSE